MNEKWVSKQIDIQYALYIQLQLIWNDMESEACSYSSLALLSNVSDKKNAAPMMSKEIKIVAIWLEPKISKKLGN